MPSGQNNSNLSKHHRRINSAETVALSLLSYRPDAQQAEPRVSDLEWLVGDGDTPQKVLTPCDTFHLFAEVRKMEIQQSN